MRWTLRIRIVFARHPFVYWACVATFSLWVVISVNLALAGAQHQRESWGRSEAVLVAIRCRAVAPRGNAPRAAGGFSAMGMSRNATASASKSPGSTG